MTFYILFKTQDCLPGKFRYESCLEFLEITTILQYYYKLFIGLYYFTSKRKAGDAVVVIVY